jgi:hypothetical protein
MILRQRIYLAAIIVANAVAWAIPDNVLALIAKDQHTLLGRYSRGHFTINLAILLISLIGLYIDQARTTRTYKRRWFQVIAVLIISLPLLLIGDALLRFTRTTTYVLDPLAYRRPSNAAWTEHVVDRPEAAFTYPNAQPGYPAFTASIHTDGRGFRNSAAPDHADLLALGDSFVEGAHVSDEHPWPVKLAQRTGLAVYSLGMSGYSPVRHLAALKQYGLALKPAGVICMLYEGNDFRSAKRLQQDTGYGLGKLLEVYCKQSPIVLSLDQLLISTFGGIGDSSGVKGIDALSWLPFRAPDGLDGKFYAFAPKQVTEALLTEDFFENSDRWEALASILEEMKRTCDAAGCRLIIAFAPTKAHVTLPLVIDRLPTDRFLAFLKIGSKRQLDADMLKSDLLPCLDAREAVVKNWCDSEDLPFISLTEPLRRAAAEGRQVYFTYDQHWTPPGHEVVAAFIADFCKGQGWRRTEPRP